MFTKKVLVLVEITMTCEDDFDPCVPAATAVSGTQYVPSSAMGTDPNVEAVMSVVKVEVI